MERNRRDLLVRSSALAASGLASRLVPLGLAGLANSAAAQSAAPDYRALVCVFLYGGVDGNSAVIPLDPAGYAKYAAVRTESSGLNIAQSALLPIQPAGAGPAYGLHPDLAAIHPLFADGRLAILANVGTLNEPTTRANYLAVRPDSLYSHSDQQSQWQSSVSDGASATGWGGRLADRLAGHNAAAGFPVVTSVAGTNLFATGASSSPLAIPPSGGLSLAGFDGGPAANARFAAMRSILAAGGENAFVKAAAGVTSSAISLSQVVNPILTASGSRVEAPFQGQDSAIAQQLRQVAKLIEAREATLARRQVFFVSLGGFDTHANELATLSTLFGQLAPALKSFHEATQLIGVADQVTAFTLSDFGRTFQPASGAGTDHAWGNHHFILGGAVKGGALYGRFPVLERSGPDDADSEGRWIPTTSVDQYGATLARWFGASPADLEAVFPNLARFPSPDLGFLA